MATSPEFNPDRSTRLTRAVGNITGWLGSFPAILFSVGIVVAWSIQGLIMYLASGHSFLDSTYQLEINTTTTIITFWMCFIIQNTQNRDGRAMQAKLDAQSHAIRLLCDKLDVPTDLLDQLAGLEEAPEKVIAEEQTRVRAEANTE